MKLFKFYEKMSDFKGDKISADKDDTTYFDFDNDTTILGTPNVKYNQVCFVDENNMIFTHGQKYTSTSDAGLTEEDLLTLSNTIKKSRPNYVVNGLRRYGRYTPTEAIIMSDEQEKQASGDYSTKYTVQTKLVRATDQATYVPTYSTYTDSDGNEQNSYEYYASGHAGLMGVDDVRCMWQSFGFVDKAPDSIVGYLSSTTTSDSSYIYVTSYQKVEEGEEYNTIHKNADNTFQTRKMFGNWKPSTTKIYPATMVSAGVMTADDKTKLNSLELFGDFTVSNILEAKTVASQSNVLREDFDPNGTPFSDTISIKFDKGDYIHVIADLSSCTLEEDEILALGQDITSWGNTLPEGNGVLHFYHKKTNEKETIFINYADTNYPSGLKEEEIDCTGTIDIKIGRDDSVPYIKINDAKVNNKISSAILIMMMNHNIYQVGSNNTTELYKVSNVHYNIIEVVRGSYLNVPGVEVSINYGESEKSFVLWNATSSYNGLMSSSDKQYIDSLEETISKLQEENTTLKKQMSSISLIKSYSKTETKGQKYTSAQLDEKFPDSGTGYEFIDVVNSIKYEKIADNDWLYFYFGD